MLEDLPITLSYEVTSPASESTPAKAQAKAEVLDGSIATLKEYRARIAELEAQALQAESARRQAEIDPIKKARIAQFLKEYWGVREGRPSKRPQNGEVKTAEDVASAVGTTAKHLGRLLKLNDLIPPLQRLISSGKLDKTKGEQLAYLTPEVQTALYDALGEEIGERTVAET